MRNKDFEPRRACVARGLRRQCGVAGRAVCGISAPWNWIEASFWAAFEKLNFYGRAQDGTGAFQRKHRMILFSLRGNDPYIFGWLFDFALIVRFYHYPANKNWSKKYDWRREVERRRGGGVERQQDESSVFFGNRWDARGQMPTEISQRRKNDLINQKWFR